MAEVTQLYYPRPCSICGSPAVVIARSPDGSEQWLCYDHLRPEVKETYHVLRKARWKGGPANDL